MLNKIKYRYYIFDTQTSKEFLPHRYSRYGAKIFFDPIEFMSIEHLWFFWSAHGAFVPIFGAKTTLQYIGIKKYVERYKNVLLCRKYIYC